MRLDNKGFTLLELLASMAIFTILLLAQLAMFKLANRKIAVLRTLISQQAASAQAPLVRKLALNSTCQLVDGIYYGKATDSNTLTLYTNSTCSSTFGTLNRLDNPSWFNEDTNSHWNVYAKSGILKIAVIKYKE